jgi:hypothetical protein
LLHTVQELVDVAGLLHFKPEIFVLLFNEPAKKVKIGCDLL